MLRKDGRFEDYSQVGRLLWSPSAPAAPVLLISLSAGFDPWRLAEAGRLARAHMARLESEAAGIAGKPFNLASPSQLADVLYEVLKARGPMEG